MIALSLLNLFAVLAVMYLVGKYVVIPWYGNLNGPPQDSPALEEQRRLAEVEAEVLAEIENHNQQARIHELRDSIAPKTEEVSE